MSIKDSGTIYDTNETMKILGKQQICEEFWRNEKVRADMKNICDARGIYVSCDALSDFFTIGYMEGKKAERARRISREEKVEV